MTPPNLEPSDLRAGRFVFLKNTYLLIAGKVSSLVMTCFSDEAKTF